MKEEEKAGESVKIAETESGLVELLQANLKQSEEILDEIKDIKKYIRWQQIWSTVRLLIIVVPLALGFIYLPPVIKDLVAYYKSF